MQRSTYRKLLSLFFLSGATALIYQVVWTRLLTLSFGSTMLAVSTVLSVFMGGLAIGSALMGRYADSVRYPVRFYGWLELFIGIYAIATPWIFGAAEKLYIVLHGTITPGFWPYALLRFGLALVMLLPPTILMGGTLPVLSKVFLNRENEKTGRALSVLYFINTAGAVAGSVLTGFFLLQLFGIRAVLIASGLINMGIFIVAFSTNAALDASLQVQKPDKSNGAESRVTGWSVPALLAVAALFFSGLAALIYEVLWTRVLTLVIGSSTYAFTIMLATFLAGIALGSAFVGRFSDDRSRGLTLLSFCQLVIGVCAIMTAGVFSFLPDLFISLFTLTGGKFWLFMAANFLLCFMVMIPAAVFMGVSFPVAGSIVVETFGSSGKRIGLLYAGNTIGAILGAFLAGFVLLPGFGIHNTLLATIILNLSVAFFISLIVLSGKKALIHAAMPAAAFGIIISILFIWQPPWDSQKMTSGPYAYAQQYQQTPIDQRISRMEQLFYKEGPVATVSVVREGDHIRLAVDGKTDAGNYKDMSTQVLLGHVPLLIRPDARDVLVIGFASGITAGAVSRHPVERIDSVEIEPSMREASAFFTTENYDILSNRQFSLIIDDGRSFLRTTRTRYDIIISEPSNPWQSGSSRLFTHETFQSASRILKPDGIMVQWMHLYGTSVESLRLVARTILSVFPHTMLWMDPNFPDVLFIASMEKQTMDPLRIREIYRENAGVKDSLARIGYDHDWSLMRSFVLNEDALQRFAGDGPLNTDNLPILEFRTPRSLYAKKPWRIMSKLCLLRNRLRPFLRLRFRILAALRQPLYSGNGGFRWSAADSSQTPKALYRLLFRWTLQIPSHILTSAI